MSLRTAFEHSASEDLDEPVIRLEGVSVRYRVPHERIPSFKEYAIRRLKGQVQYHHFWALKDVSLEVYPGEVVGIIGPNGAGKSTLLKVVARVLRPTRGRVQVRGRVSPLLELGAGFDPELTGRENVYLNGMILGRSRRQIDERFNHIVAFAGLEDFIDAPLRTYSTGMVARLGFAVATDVRPEILIVDEILGVGDADFQTRSFERIQSFQAAGTTILLVSHSLERVQEMCSRVVWLDKGQVKAIGTPEQVIHHYLEQVSEQEAKRLSASMEETSSTTSEETPHRWGTGVVEITRVQITDANGSPKTIFQTGEPLCLHMDFIAHHPVESPVFGVAIHRNDGVHITGPNTAFAGLTLPTISGPGEVIYKIPALPLLEGKYFFSVAVVSQDDTELYDYHDRLYPFRVQNHSTEIPEKYGLMTMQGHWQVITETATIEE